ncbi:FKBP-type peptidyl-prolyl cis-trans isomerase [Bacteroides caecigallinarum]|uniref:Peptidyl-prolyl cis-trans isomerase n=1 Tax=Candidatus Phocaeicola faecigallinarum TaxID=2838732 RepID=A0A948X0A6_9BACT|nr:FKBP-type peptidyl-prolyl cis-trans isomerase [Bacteroides caecigallinarum]MBU3839293.1 FKBP-type peptidyl-prolyl cis-trans isomerase [Candidatus Phocaeicola faecigallinarum]MBM6883042.1 FKBP-type peptidyl-prolyl cis-trans isomerase [Bacteroides caecigallinarum]MBM6889372.1 FKBP-type peptidyl-prolyl cis-trans isomerase [Bacteroides caecigallinarum]MCF2552699.1 FKBP-type peptidyl-prolyl cis-trans isomerase [Bacteroides caecigallinarum]MCF2581051.1 FKBP-type peptidyl-prolyl cis-trans isomeras
MKKGTALMVLAAAAGLASCGQSGTPKANMKSDVDTLSYMVGVSNSQGLKDYVVGRLGVDTTYMADFVRGIKEGMKNTSAKEKAYMAGMQIGQQVSGDMYEAINNQLFAGDSTTTMSKENFLAGFIAAVEENSLVTADSASVYVRTKSEEIKTKALEAKYGEYKKENEEFLANNKSKDGIKVTESGLQYRIIKEGKGEIPTKTSRVKVHYKGTMIDGTEFDSSYERKEPTTFRADQVIKGWTEALTMMPVGSKWELYIPQELGYGSREAGKIKPFSTLIFEVELISIEK